MEWTSSNNYHRLVVGQDMMTVIKDGGGTTCTVWCKNKRKYSKTFYHEVTTEEATSFIHGVYQKNKCFWD
jgi:hypothetical protein